MDTKNIHISWFKVWVSGYSLGSYWSADQTLFESDNSKRDIEQLLQKNKRFKGWSYFSFEIDPKDLSSFKIISQKAFWLNLTVPHKVIALDLLDQISDSSKAIGAVNTLKWTDSGYEGFNTDGYGMSKGIERDLVLIWKKVLF